MLDLARALDIAETEAHRCCALADTVPHDLALAHLPGWTVADVIAHLAGDYRWATGIVTTRSWDGQPLRAVPDRGAALVTTLHTAAEAMLTALAEAIRTPGVQCPNFAERDAGTLGFWVRRQAHESVMHRWDLEVPAGRHELIPADVAADSVDEALHIYARRYGPHDLADSCTLLATDTGDAWEASPAETPGRISVSRIAAPAVADIAGPAAALLMAIYHRPDPAAGDLTFGPDEPAIRRFLAGPLTA